MIICTNTIWLYISNLYIYLSNNSWHCYKYLQISSECQVHFISIIGVFKSMNSIDPISISSWEFDACFMLHKLPIVCFYHIACSNTFAILNGIGKIKYICLSEIRYKLRTSTIYHIMIHFIVRKIFCYTGNKANYVVISEL